MADETLFRERSRFQDIHLFREGDGSLGLTLDGVWQFHERDEGTFHQMLAELPLRLAPQRSRVLILGGGDALALRDVLRFPDVNSVELCELDERVLAMARELEDMRVLTRHALDDRRVRCHVDDARSFVTRSTDCFDVVICDFPSPTTPQLRELFTPEFFQNVSARVSDEGVVSVQVSAGPDIFWSVHDDVAQIFDHVAAQLLNLDDPNSAAGDNWANFLLASRSPLTPGVRFGTHGPLSGRAREDFQIRGRRPGGFDTPAYGAMDTDD